MPHGLKRRVAFGVSCRPAWLVLVRSGDWRGRNHTPTSASSLTDSRIVTLWSGFATLVETAAESPASPAPMMMRWRDIEWSDES